MLKFFSVAFVLLLAFGAVWGQCAGCPLVAPQKEHDCCGKRSGHCQVPSPKSQPEKPCPDQALAPVVVHDTQLTATGLIAPAPAALIPEIPAASFEAVPTTSAKPDTGPPELYLLNSYLRV